MLCPKCNKNIDESNEFCPACGKRLKKLTFSFFKKDKAESVDVSTEEKAIPNASKRKTLFVYVSVIAVIVALVFIIVGLASSKSILWAAFIVGGIVLAWICSVPIIFLNKRRFLFSFLSFTAFVIPVLFVIELVSPTKDWFYALALPIAIVSLMCLWVIYSLFAFIKLDKFYAASISIIFLLVMDTVINVIVSTALEKSFSIYSFIINFVIFSAVSFLLFYIRRRKK